MAAHGGYWQMASSKRGTLRWELMVMMMTTTKVPFYNVLLHFFFGQNGTLKIIDRKKHIFKLAQGEYIAPEKIENIYTHSDPVAQIFVHGDSLQVCRSAATYQKAICLLT